MVINRKNYKFLNFHKLKGHGEMLIKNAKGLYRKIYLRANQRLNEKKIIGNMIDLHHQYQGSSMKWR